MEKGFQFSVTDGRFAVNSVRDRGNIRNRSVNEPGFMERHKVSNDADAEAGLNESEGGCLFFAEMQLGRGMKLDIGQL